MTQDNTGAHGISQAAKNKDIKIRRRWRKPTLQKESAHTAVARQQKTYQNTKKKQQKRVARPLQLKLTKKSAHRSMLTCYPEPASWRTPCIRAKTAQGPSCVHRMGGNLEAMANFCLFLDSLGLGILRCEIEKAMVLRLATRYRR